MKVNYEIFRGQNGLAEIKIYGVIGTDKSQLSAATFCAELQDLAISYPQATIRMNCDGGSVKDGMLIYNEILRSKMAITMYCDGIVASMASVIFQSGKKPGNKRIMATGSRMMIHQASLSMGGQSDDLRDAADALDGINSDLQGIYMKASGQSEKVVKSWMQRGKNTWLTAAQCVALGLADEVEDGMPVQMTFIDDSLKMVAQFNEHLIEDFQSNSNNNQNLIMDKKVLALSLGLAENATEAEIQAKLISLKNADAEAKAKIAVLETENQKHLSDKITAMLDGAVASGKITEAQKATFEPLAKVDYANCKLAIDGMVSAAPVAAAVLPVQVSISGAIAQAQAAMPATKTWNEYAKTDSAYLESLEKTNPTAWKALFKAQFGVEPQ
jgi:ATP-dependent protease ClpP protease subunit